MRWYTIRWNWGGGLYVTTSLQAHSAAQAKVKAGIPKRATEIRVVRGQWNLAVA